jgi:four helix bundle protein
MASRNYRDLIAWQRAMDLVELTYRETAGFPAGEKFALVVQMRRAAVSVPSNIAEGQGRGGNPEFVRFLRIAHGSLRELETQALIAGRLKFSSDAAVVRFLEMSGEVGRLINGLIRSKV